MWSTSPAKRSATEQSFNRDRRKICCLLQVARDQSIGRVEENGSNPCALWLFFETSEEKRMGSCSAETGSGICDERRDRLLRGHERRGALGRSHSVTVRFRDQEVRSATRLVTDHLREVEETDENLASFSRDRPVSPLRPLVTGRTATLRSFQALEFRLGHLLRHSWPPLVFGWQSDCFGQSRGTYTLSFHRLDVCYPSKSLPGYCLLFQLLKRDHLH